MRGQMHLKTTQESPRISCFCRNLCPIDGKTGRKRVIRVWREWLETVDMQQDLISVIVPVYNVAKYLDRCISSIVGQTYRNLEIILCDDESSDESGTIADAWAQKDHRICGSVHPISAKNTERTTCRNCVMRIPCISFAMNIFRKMRKGAHK